MKLQNALHHANKAHGARTDKKGFLYLIHPVCVAFALQEIGENAQVEGLLHDVQEDHPEYPLPLEKLSPRQAHTLDLLTHDEDVTYREYIYELLDDEDACWVKLADIGHNTCKKRQLPDDKRRADERYYPYASLIVSALMEYHKQPLEKIERVLYAFEH